MKLREGKEQKNGIVNEMQWKITKVLRDFVLFRHLHKILQPKSKISISKRNPKS